MTTAGTSRFVRLMHEHPVAGSLPRHISNARWERPCSAPPSRPSAAADGSSLCEEARLCFAESCDGPLPRCEGFKLPSRMSRVWRVALGKLGHGDAARALDRGSRPGRVTANVWATASGSFRRSGLCRQRPLAPAQRAPPPPRDCDPLRSPPPRHLRGGCQGGAPQRSQALPRAEERPSRHERPGAPEEAPRAALAPQGEELPGGARRGAAQGAGRLGPVMGRRGAASSTSASACAEICARPPIGKSSRLCECRTRCRESRCEVSPDRSAPQGLSTSKTRKAKSH